MNEKARAGLLLAQGRSEELKTLSATASTRMATYISKEKCLSFPVLLSQKGRLPAQPNFYLGTSNLDCRVVMYAKGGTAIFLSQFSATPGHYLLCWRLELSLEQSLQ